jgi:hypothetical protein
MSIRTGRPATVTSNSVAIPFHPDVFVPLPDSTALLSATGNARGEDGGEGAALRRRLSEDGVVYLRDVLDQGEVRRLRETYFAAFPPGYLRPGTPPAAGLFSGDPTAVTMQHGMPGHPAHAFVRSEAFLRFVAQPRLEELARTLLGTEAVRLPRAVLRHFDRLSGRSSRAHTDYAYMDRGTAAVITMWVPIGDCPVESGGLVYLEGSHREPPDRLAGLRAVTDRPGDDRPISHDLGWVAHRLKRRWLWADYRTGDVAIHGPHIVHASLDTATEAMRMSVDVRFAAAGGCLDDRWLRPWSADDGA